MSNETKEKRYTFEALVMEVSYKVARIEIPARNYRDAKDMADETVGCAEWKEIKNASAEAETFYKNEYAELIDAYFADAESPVNGEYDFGMRRLVAVDGVEVDEEDYEAGVEVDEED